MDSSTRDNLNQLRQADWELDFYSRPIIEADGKKRWELLITSTEDFTGGEVFKWTKSSRKLCT